MDATIRLYDADAYRTSFEATVVQCEQTEKGYAVILDQTCFFPEEGGQTADEGSLIAQGTSIPIRDVQIDADKIIRHMVRESIAVGTTVTGKVNWEKRFSDMQQHSGEHIISGLIHSTYGYRNVGFHLSKNDVTLDLDGMLTAEQIADLERRANEVVFRNLEVIAEYPAPEVLKELDYRSKIEIDGPIRIVTFPGVDMCACCAPHVARTGEIGMIKITHAAKYKSGIRLHMLCGARAIADAQVKQDQLEAIGIALSVKQEKTAAAVDRLLGDLAQLKQELAAVNRQLAAGKAQRIPEGTENVCLFETNMEKEAHRELVNLITERCTGICGVFVGNDENGYRYVIGSAGQNDARKINQQLKDCCGARGGGSASMVQGAVNGTREQIQKLFEGIV